jgi:hypothetical protein
MHVLVSQIIIPRAPSKGNMRCPVDIDIRLFSNRRVDSAPSPNLVTSGKRAVLVGPLWQVYLVGPLCILERNRQATRVAVGGMFVTAIMRTDSMTFRGHIEIRQNVLNFPLTQRKVRPKAAKRRARLKSNARKSRISRQRPPSVSILCISLRMYYEQHRSSLFIYLLNYRSCISLPS